MLVHTLALQDHGWFGPLLAGWASRPHERHHIITCTLSLRAVLAAIHFHTTLRVTYLISVRFCDMDGDLALNGKSYIVPTFSIVDLMFDLTWSGVWLTTQ